MRHLPSAELFNLSQGSAVLCDLLPEHGVDAVPFVIPVIRQVLKTKPRTVKDFTATMVNQMCVVFKVEDDHLPDALKFIQKTVCNMDESVVRNSVLPQAVTHCLTEHIGENRELSLDLLDYGLSLYVGLQLDKAET
eukprot:UN29256